MKKKIFSLFIFFLLLVGNNFACTNFIITSGASADGSNMITYAADSQHMYGELYYFPSRDFPEGALLKVFEWDTGKYLGAIKQVLHTYSVVGNMNEYQLAIGETTYTGRKELQDTTGLIDYGSLIYITLQRAKTAREAIKVMNELVNEYGYYSTGESFSIIDKNEAWIMDFIGKGVGNKGAVWVARRIPDGYISGHANQARITTFPLNDKENCLYAKDVISFARKKGYFNGKDKDFSFADAYAPLDYGALRFCEARVWAMFNRVNKNCKKYFDYVDGVTGAERMPLWIKPDKKISTHDLMELMRDHFEGTPMDMTKGKDAGPFGLPYRWRPLVWKVDSVSYLWERATSTPQTGFSFVAQSRKNLPDPIGGILWFGVDDTDMTVYVPMYCGIKSVPDNLRKGNGSLKNFTWDASFWAFNFVSNYVYTRYNEMIIDLKKVQRELEFSFLKEIIKVDEEATKLFEKDKNAALGYITSFSKKQSIETHQRWIKFGQELFTKYLDGYKKDEKGVPQYCGYSEDFYRDVVAKRGEELRMKDYGKETIISRIKQKAKDNKKHIVLENKKSIDKKIIISKKEDTCSHDKKAIATYLITLIVGISIGYLIFLFFKK